jgi:hypothetical protein
MLNKKVFKVFVHSVTIIVLSLFQTGFILAQDNIITIKPVKSEKGEDLKALKKGKAIQYEKNLVIDGAESVLQTRPSNIKLELGEIFPDSSLTVSGVVSLEVVDLISPEAKLNAGTGKGDLPVNFPQAAYKGRINSTDWVNLTFSGAGTIGWMSVNNSIYLIQPVQSPAQNSGIREHIIREITSPEQDEIRCGLNTASLPTEIKKLMSSLNSYMTRKSADTRLTAKVALETDYETYVSFGNDINLATSWLLSIASSVSQIYEQEVNVGLEVVYTRVWTTPDDPYTQKGYSLFPEFQNYWNANMQSLDRDVAILIIKDPNRLSGGQGSLDALGNITSSYAISGEGVLTVTHELGHVFGSPHTHNCSWPAGSGWTLAPIDKCATVEGDCDIKEIIPQEGTIMSYCPTSTQTFGTLVCNLIRARAEVKLGAGDLLVSSVTGKVNISGTGLAGVTIMAYRGDGTSISTTTTSDGTFSLNLYYDDYSISAARTDYFIKPSGRTSGSFYVTVADTKVTGLNFEAKVLSSDLYEPDNSFGQATSIPSDGTVQQHTLHNTSDIDYAKFDAVSGKSYYLSLLLGDVIGSPTLTLIGTDGTTVLQNASYPPSMVWKAPLSGTYYIRVSGTNGYYGLLLSLAPFLNPAINFSPLFWSDSDWGDYDNDGDLDLLASGMDDNYTMKTVLFRNDNSILNQADAGMEQITTTSNILVKWIDIDNDGDPDAFIGAGNVAKIYLNEGGSFANKIIIDDKLVSLQSAEFADYDNDGDQDILIQSFADVNYKGDFPLLHLYRNTNGSFENINLNLRGVSFGKAVWGDYNGDDDPDIFVVGASNVNQVSGSSSADNPFTKVYLNTNGNFSDDNISLVQVASFPDIAFSDFDSDGDLDLALAGQDQSELTAKIYRNDNGSYTDIGTLMTGVHNVSMKWGDYDNDGDPDLIITGQEKISASSSALTKLYVNNGGVFEEAYFNSIFPDIGVGTVSWSDYDNDSDLDLLFIGEAPNTKGLGNLVSNESNVINTPPAAPSGLNEVVNGNSVTLSWLSAQDDRTPDKGLTYNLCVGATPGGTEVLSPLSNLQSGKRLVAEAGNSGLLLQHKIRNLLPGTYYWTVQAIDNSFAGGAFAATSSFEIQAPTSVSEIAGDKPELKVYPNPVADVLTIEYRGNNIEKRFTIYNSLGQNVYYGRITEKTTVPAVSFSPGIYLIKLETGKTVMFNKTGD